MGLNVASGTMPASAAAPRFVGQGRIEFAERPLREPGPGELLLRVRANAICGTDREQYLAGSTITPGHEAAGVVVAAGDRTSTRVGAGGVVYLMDFCGACRSCRLGHTNQCLAKRADMGFTHDGGYGPYELVHESNFFPVDGVPLADATLLLDVMGTTGHALRRGGLVREDVASVAVAGAGPIGLGVAAMARLLLGEDVPVLISDVVPYRLALAERLGAQPVDARRTGLAEACGRAGLNGADLGVDTTGKGAARQGLLDALSRRGALVCVGHGEGLRVDVSRQLIAPERAVLGSEYFRYDELPANLELLRGHHAYLGQIVTHRFPVGAIAEAFQVFLGGDSGKVLVEQEEA